LDNKRYGPFEVTRTIGHEIYELKLPTTWMIHNIFNKNLLTKWREPKFQKQKNMLLPLPEIINEEEEYEIEAIRKHRKQKNSIQYLVYWKKYSNEDNKWILESRLGHTKKLLKEYWQIALDQSLEKEKLPYNISILKYHIQKCFSLLATLLLYTTRLLLSTINPYFN